MRVMSLTSIVCTVSFLLLTACHKEDKDHDIPPSKYDRNFMIDASRANLAEVAAGEIAVKRGTDADVRAFGAKMVTEHKKAQEDLLKLAGKWDIDLPDEPDSTHIMIAKKLMTLSGHAFDKYYIQVQQGDHEWTVDWFNKELIRGENVEVKAYAAKYLPHIVEHKMMADAIADKLD